MKKKTKIILLVLIIVIILIGLIIWGLYEASITKHYSFTITNIEGTKITGARLVVSQFDYDINSDNYKDYNGNTVDFSKLTVGDKVYIYNEKQDLSYLNTIQKITENQVVTNFENLEYFSLDIGDVSIKDINGNKIDISGLSVGDRIEVTNKEVGLVPARANSYEGYPYDYLNNIKKLKVIKDDPAEAKAIGDRNMNAIKKAIVVKVEEDYLSVAEIDDNTKIFKVKYPENNITSFEQGQEVLIYFNGRGNIDLTMQIDNVGKIEVINGENATQITEESLKSASNSFDNISINVSDISSSGITFTIEDSNEMPYNYSNISYKILKKQTKSSSSNITNDESASIVGGMEVNWVEVTKLENGNSTITTDDINQNTFNEVIDWSNVYGQLVEGEYELVIEINDANLNNISISFEVEANGNAKYNDYKVNLNL